MAERTDGSSARLSENIFLLFLPDTTDTVCKTGLEGGVSYPHGVVTNINLPGG